MSFRFNDSVNLTLDDRSGAKRHARICAKGKGDRTFTGEKLENILNSIDDGIALVGLDGKVLDCNEAASKQLGLAREELIGKNVFDMVAPEDRQKAIEGSYKVLEKGKVVNEVRLMRKNGSAFYAEISTALLYGRDSKPTGFIGVTRDITERKQAEEALRLSKEKFTKLFKNGPSAMSLTRLSDGKIIDANDLVIDILGYSPREVIGKTTLELGIWVKPDERLEFTRALLAEGFVRNKDMLFQRKDGNQITVNLSASLIEIEREQYFLSSFIDVTERKKAEEALRDSEERFRVVAEAANVMVYETDVRTGKSKAYRGSEELVGFKPDEVDFGIEWVSSRIHPDDVANVLENLNRVLTNSNCEGYTVKYRFLHKDGRYITLQDTAKAIRDSYGQVIRIVGGAIDVTEIEKDKQEIEQYSKHLEKLVEERTKQLRESERLAAIGQTAGMVGHDLRNPLQSIIGEVYLAKSEIAQLPDNEQKSSLQESIQAIAEQVSYMDKIVSDLQTFFKPVKPQMQMIELKPLIVALLAQQHTPKNIQINMQIPDALTIEADPQLLKRVLINLVTNAVQAMPRGGELAIETQASTGQIQIIVADNGVGIPEEIKSKVFNPLFTTKAKGQGLGLAVCKRIIEAQDGTVRFESEMGKGTKFIVSLPAK